MTAVALSVVEPFFAPVSYSQIDALVAEYEQKLNQIDSVLAIVNSDLAGVLNYFTEGNSGNRRLGDTLSAERIFQRDGAVGALNADFWSRALRLTDVMDFMPQKRRNEWGEQIRNPLGVRAPRLQQYELEAGRAQVEWSVAPLPDFVPEVVRASLAELLHSRARFFAERVDGIFQSLSRKHLTNSPAGFGQRFIIACVLDKWGHVEWSKAGVVNDLRCVLARLAGRPEPKYDATRPAIEIAKGKTGQWVDLDGGALRVRVYAGVGTAHLEINPEVADRLNGVLATLYPMAIPDRTRQRGGKTAKAKEHVLREDILPMGVLAELSALQPASRRLKPDFPERYEAIPKALSFNYGRASGDASERAEAERVLAMLGGVKDGGVWQFDYEPRDVLDEVITSGCVPEDKSHQFYQTKANLADLAAELADIQEGQLNLEPSAGTGALAERMKLSRTVCVEVSALRCRVLKGRGFNAIEADFLQWAKGQPAVFDRVLMNPPFSEGRWLSHWKAAAGLVAAAGKVVAILPATACGDELGEGWIIEKHGPFEGEFDGTGVRVVVVVASKEAQ